MLSLTREEFLALVRLRGYSLTAVAGLWGVSRSRLSQIAADPQRATHWDYALWGLPAKSATAKVEARRRRMLPLLRRQAAPARGESTPSHLALWIEVGDVWMVRDSPGEHLPVGSEGVVQTLTVVRGVWQVAMFFPATAYAETFAVSYLQEPTCFLSATGRNVHAKPEA